MAVRPLSKSGARAMAREIEKEEEPLTYHWRGKVRPLGLEGTSASSEHGWLEHGWHGRPLQHSWGSARPEYFGFYASAGCGGQQLERVGHLGASGALWLPRRRPRSQQWRAKSAIYMVFRMRPLLGRKLPQAEEERLKAGCRAALEYGVSLMEEEEEEEEEACNFLFECSCGTVGPSTDTAKAADTSCNAAQASSSSGDAAQASTVAGYTAKASTVAGYTKASTLLGPRGHETRTDECGCSKPPQAREAQEASMRTRGAAPAPPPVPKRLNLPTPPAVPVSTPERFQPAVPASTTEMFQPYPQVPYPVFLRAPMMQPVPLLLPGHAPHLHMVPAHMALPYGAVPAATPMQARPISSVGPVGRKLRGQSRRLRCIRALRRLCRR